MPDDRVQTRRIRVAKVIETALGADGGSVGVSLDEDLHERGLTSLNMVNVMLAVEAEFGFMIPKRDLHPDNFKSLRAIESLVAKLSAD